MATASSLSFAVEQLYQQFSGYPLHGPIHGCPCCTTPAESRILETVPLRQLTEEQIEQYAFQAMTTWGDVADFQHFLPRILELKATGELWTDFFIIRSKLDLAGYAQWTEPEKAAVRAVFLEWTALQWQQHAYNKEDLGELIQILGSIDPILTSWTTSYDDLSFENFAHFACYTLPELNMKKGRASQIKKGFTAPVVATLNQWFQQRLPRLEAGFFYYADTQPAVAQLASFGYDFVSRLPSAQQLP